MFCFQINGIPLVCCSNFHFQENEMWLQLLWNTSACHMIWCKSNVFKLLKCNKLVGQITESILLVWVIFVVVDQVDVYPRTCSYICHVWFNLHDPTKLYHKLEITSERHECCHPLDGDESIIMLTCDINENDTNTQ